MNFKLIASVFISLLFFSLIGLFYFSLDNDPKKLESQLIGRSAPEFTVRDLLKENQQYNQDLFKGKITLLNFWASWCHGCYQDHTYWNQFILQQEKSDNEINLVGLNYKDTKAKALNFLNTQGNPYKEILFDYNGRIGIEFGVYGIPETFIIDPQSVVRFRYAGIVDSKVFAEKFAPIIKQINATTEKL